MSNGDSFISYLHRNDPSYTEEQKLEAYKNYKAQTVTVDELEEDEFYNGEVPEINEAHRTQRPSPRPAPRPAPAPAPRPAPVPAEPDFDDDTNYVEPAPVRRRPAKKPQTFTESAGYINNPAFSEAFSLIDEMKEKMTAMFFKYGMTGLTKLNECMLDMCDEIMNPPPPAPKIIYKEKEPEVVVAPAPVKKTVVKKKPVAAKVAEKKTEKVTETAAAPQVTKPKIVKKAEPAKTEEEILKEKKANLDAMLETADLSELGSTLTKQSSVQVDEGAKRLALVKANSERIKKLSEEKQEAQHKEESNEPVEAFEVVADGEPTFEMPSDEENTTTDAELETAAN